MVGAKPIIVSPQRNYRPYKAQYPLSKEAEAGIAEIHNSLVKVGAIVPCPDSPCNTPILPVWKASGAGRFVQVFHIVNDAVFACAPFVLNPVIILSQFPSDACWFTVVDLANAFFSMPVHPDSQYIT